MVYFKATSTYFYHITKISKRGKYYNVYRTIYKDALYTTCQLVQFYGYTLDYVIDNKQIFVPVRINRNFTQIKANGHRFIKKNHTYQLL